MANPTPTPNGRNTLVTNLVVRDCAKAIAFYVDALGAEERARFPAPDGKIIWHAELVIGDTVFFVNDEMPGAGCPAPSRDAPSPVSIWVGAADCDAAYRRAVSAGAAGAKPPEDMFWGDRVGVVVDPFGYQWCFTTHVKDLSPEEMRRAGEAFARKMAAACG